MEAKDWWSLTGSNRRPHACKARALPAELKPRRLVFEFEHRVRLAKRLVAVEPQATLWWARVDSNYRPHPYQGCALTN